MEAVGQANPGFWAEEFTNADYLAKMRKDKTWATTADLFAAAAFLGVDIMTYYCNPYTSE